MPNPQTKDKTIPACGNMNDLSFNEFLSNSDFSCLFDSEKTVRRVFDRLCGLFPVDSFAFVGPNPDEWEENFKRANGIDSG